MHGTSELFTSFQTSLKYHVPNNPRIETVDYPNNIPQSYSNLLTWLDKQLDPTIPRILIAESFSGPLAIQLAQLRPDTIQGVALAASFSHHPAPASLSLLPFRHIFKLLPPSAVLRHFLLGEKATPTTIQELKSILKTTSKPALEQRIRSILSLEEKDCPSLPNTPILILQAQHDNIIPWATQTHLESHFPHAEVHWIPAPHLMLQTQPNLCVEAIKHWAKLIHH